MYKIHNIPKGVIANVWTKNMAVKGNHILHNPLGLMLTNGIFVRTMTVSI